MANIIGMDVDAVEQLSRDLKTQAGEIHSVISAVDRLINQMQDIWKGQDSVQFAGWWRDQHRPALDRARQAIEGLGTSAHNNAADQRSASSR